MAITPRTIQVVGLNESGEEVRLIPNDDGSLPVSATLENPLQAIESAVEKDSVLTMPGRRPDAFPETNFEHADATTAQTVLAGVTGKSHYITDLIISVSGAMNVNLEDDTGTPVKQIPTLYFPQAGIFSKTFDTPVFCGVGKPIKVKSSGAGNLSVKPSGHTY